MKDTLEEKEFQVNDTLWKAYGAVSGGWGVGPAVAGIPTYYEYDVREPGWSTINSTSYGNVSSSVEQYGDAAIMIISRLGSENGDLDFASDECIDECYLNPSYQEAEVLEELKAMKDQGKIKKIILLLNSGNAMNVKYLKNYGIDACMWVGFGGNAAFDAIAENTSEYCGKGDIVGVKGRVQSRVIEKDDKKETELQIICEKITFLSSKPKETE